MKNLRRERERESVCVCVSYQPLGLADVIVRPIVVHRWLALSVLPIPLLDGSELRGRPPLTHHLPSL
jgi:hypothetical protein